MSALIAYHGNHQLKTQVVNMLRQHQEMDRLQKGSYYEPEANGRWHACAVGCTLESLRRIEGLSRIAHGDHVLYERYLGIPRALARIEDGLFESLPNDLAQAWPVRFAQAIQPGADLSMVVPRFLHWLLSNPDGGVQRGVARRPMIGQSVQVVIDLYARWIETGIKPPDHEWRAYAAAYAADAYAYAYAAYAYADDAAAAAYAADAYADDAERIRQADKLIELLGDAPRSASVASATDWAVA